MPLTCADRLQISYNLMYFQVARHLASTLAAALPPPHCSSSCSHSQKPVDWLAVVVCDDAHGPVVRPARGRVNQPLRNLLLQARTACRQGGKEANQAFS
jgi:hypothetical protein